MCIGCAHPTRPCRRCASNVHIGPGNPRKLGFGLQMLARCTFRAASRPFRASQRGPLLDVHITCTRAGIGQRNPLRCGSRNRVDSPRGRSYRPGQSRDRGGSERATPRRPRVHLDGSSPRPDRSAEQEEEIVTGSVHDQAARDDAHLRSLGIKPELRRTLGFLSNFAVAFSYISVSTGTFTNQAVAFGVGGPAIFWAWPLVILGQTFVALNFAELSSHFPVAGSIYQWSKRLSHQTLGWFTGWIYFWAGVITVTAVAVTVPLVLANIMGFDLASSSPLPGLDMWQFVGLGALITTTLIN